MVHFVTAVHTRRQARRGRLGVPSQRLQGHPAPYRDETKTLLKSQPKIWDRGADGEHSAYGRNSGSGSEIGRRDNLSDLR